MATINVAKPPKAEDQTIETGNKVAGDALHDAENKEADPKNQRADDQNQPRPMAIPNNLVVGQQAAFEAESTQTPATISTCSSRTLLADAGYERRRSASKS